MQESEVPGLHYAVERRRRSRIVMMAIPSLLGVLLWLWIFGQDSDYFYSRSNLPKDFYLTILISLFGTSGIALVMTYLQTGFKRSSEHELELERIRREKNAAETQERSFLSASADALRANVAHAQSEIDRALSLATNVGETDKAALIDDLKTQIRAEAGESLLSEIRANIAASLKRDIRDKDLSIRFEDSRARLLRELEALGRRGNLNLALGAFTTVIGLSILGMSVFQEVTTSKDIWEFAAHFAPRLTLVVMIELFAYFFLALYKTSLQEIKYFQNELTNVESKQIALSVSLAASDQSLITSVISSLAATERNHVLSKDQTTVELEKAKIDREGRGDIAKYLSELLQKKT